MKILKKNRYFKRIIRSRILSWIEPSILSRGLLSSNKNKVSLGAAVGVFISILIPVGQIPLAIIVSYLIRVNMAVESAMTLVSNPVTYIPIYIAAYNIGLFFSKKVEVIEVDGDIGLIDAGFYLLIGLFIMALSFSVITYILFMLSYRIRALRRYRAISKKTKRLN